MSSVINNVLMKYLGTPYKFNGDSLKDGVDCINLCSMLGKEFGNNIPNINHMFCSQDNYDVLFNDVRTDTTLWVECKPSAHALCAFRINGKIKHVGYMINDDEFVHILESSKVTVDSISNPQWNRRFVACYKYIGNKDLI